jgi:methylated-DNA-[protein]-cysteine S-methyltransferase
MKNLDYDPEFAAWLGDSDAGPLPNPLTNQLDEVFAALPPQDGAEHAIRLLQTQLGDQLAGPVFFDSLKGTPLGTVYLAISPRGLVALNFGISEESFLAEVEKRTGVQPVRSSEQVVEVEGQVAAYLTGERTQFDIPVDLASLTDFQRQVLEATSQVPRGQVTTYAEIARRIGRPKASRAVGQALGSNPVPLIIPCHRVVAANGALTGYSGGGGIETKARLLALEGAQLA